MTPQERQLIDELFDRLAKVESAPRDAEAMSAIMQGLRNAPNAIYPLVQTVLLQDEALRRAAERIQQLEQGQAQEQGQSGGFLDGLPEDGVVMCHPGLVDETLVALDPMTTVREIEHAYLAGDTFAELLAANKVTLS